jgi:hypothetical protein
MFLTNSIVIGNPVKIISKDASPTEKYVAFYVGELYENNK